MTEAIGRCSKCGAICPHCAPRNGFTLSTLPESVRGIVREVLDQTSASQAQQDRLVMAIAHLDEKYIKRAKRIWDTMGYARKGVGYGYFKAICLHCAESGSREQLDGLPPLYITEEDE